MSATDGQPPFTESELRSARMQIQIKDCTAALQRFFEAWEASVQQEAARLQAVRERAAVAAAERKKRVDGAEQWLREQAEHQQS